MDKDFPCYFATMAEHRKDLHYTYVDSTNLELLPGTASAFVRKVHARAPSHSALVAFVKPEPVAQPLRFYERRFWEILQWLHDHDPVSWPIGRFSPDPRNREFWYCLGGDGMFVFGNAPAYIRRRSRNLGDGLVIVFVPNISFFNIRIGTPAGAAARKRIRSRLAAWDRVPPSPEFGAVDEDPIAWKSYFLTDGNAPKIGACPLHISVDVGSRKKRPFAR
jgi:FPC/CPF motif-containing protein YcgG